MLRAGVLIAVALIAALVLIGHSVYTGRAAVHPAPALSVPSSITPEPERARRASIVPQEAAAEMPKSPGLRHWHDARSRHRSLYPLKQPVDRRPLHRQKQWRHALQVFGNQDDAHLEDARYARLAAALPRATNPVVRQNLIFITVNALPLDRARELLSSLETDAQDREDICGALAFSGDGAAYAQWRALAAGPTTAPVRRIVDSINVHDGIAAKGTDEARRTLRAWRLIEALDRDVYFKMTTAYAPHDWLPPPDPSGAHADRVLRAWLARYEGHPGSDDVAYRIARIALARGDAFDAARWWSRSSTLPDLDVRRHSPRGALRGCAEFLLTRAQLDVLLNDEGLDTPNRQWLQYIRVRRAAVEVGIPYALDVAAGVAASEPMSPVGRAYRLRWAVPPPKGLDSGMAPLPPDDPLRIVEHAKVPAPRKPKEENRLQPDREPTAIPIAKTARQFRIWETLAELDRRASRARGDTRTDFRYKQGAVFYHQARLALIPTYHVSKWWLRYGAGYLNLSRERREELEAAFRERCFGHYRALRIWQEIEQRASGYPAMDKVLYSQGLAWRRHFDFAYAPVYFVEKHPDVVRPLVDAFERCAERFPDSELATGSRAAAAYWRRRAPRLFPN